MVGYGEEDNHFVVELTYNYGIKSYKKGNDFKVTIEFISTTLPFLMLHWTLECNYLLQ